MSGNAMEISQAPPTDVQPVVHEIYSQSTGTWQYVVADVSTSRAVVIDPALDPQELEQGIATTSADQILDLIQSKKYNIERILETQGSHSYKTAAFYLRQQLLDRTGVLPRVCVGKSLNSFQRYFARRQTLGSLGWNKHDDAFDDGATFKVGKLQVTVLSLGAHTAEHCGYVIGTHVFIGDAIFKPAALTKDVDTVQLWQSIQRLLSLPDHYEVHVSNANITDPSDTTSAGTEQSGQLCATVASLKTKYMFGLNQSDFLTLCREQEASTAVKPKRSLLTKKLRTSPSISSGNARPEGRVGLLRSLFSRRKDQSRAPSIASTTSLPINDDSSAVAMKRISNSNFPIDPAHASATQTELARPEVSGSSIHTL